MRDESSQYSQEGHAVLGGRFKAATVCIGTVVLLYVNVQYILQKVICPLGGKVGTFSDVGSRQCLSLSLSLSLPPGRGVHQPRRDRRGGRRKNRAHQIQGPRAWRKGGRRIFSSPPPYRLSAASVLDGRKNISFLSTLLLV